MTTYYVGIVTDVSLIRRNIISEKPVSLSTSKQKAGDLAQQWLKDNDPDNLKYTFEGVMKIKADYVEI